MARHFFVFFSALTLASTIIIPQAGAEVRRARNPASKPPAATTGVKTAEANRSVENALNFLIANQGVFGSGGWCKGGDTQCASRSGAPRWESMSNGVMISKREDACHMLVRFGESYMKDGKETYYQGHLNWPDLVEIQKRSGGDFGLAEGSTEFLFLFRDGKKISLTTSSLTMTDRFGAAFGYLKRNCATANNLGF